MATPKTPVPAEPVTPPKYEFAATLHLVNNRGRAPISFLTELVDWGKKALTESPEIFAPNNVALDAYTVIRSRLATAMGHDGSNTEVFRWDNLLHRAGAMLELMRVHAGFESSWKWNEGVDRTNKNSMHNKTGEETGIFQVSFDSTWLDSNEGKDVMGRWLAANGVDDDKPETFIPRMKTDHAFAMEFYARLARVSIAWAGPLLRHGEDSVYPYLSRDSMREFMRFLQ